MCGLFVVLGVCMCVVRLLCLFCCGVFGFFCVFCVVVCCCACFVLFGLFLLVLFCLFCCGGRARGLIVRVFVLFCAHPVCCGACI